MTGSNRRANAGRKAQQPKSKPQRQSNRTSRRKAELQRVDASRISAPLMQSNSNHRQMHNEMTTLRGSDFLGFVSVLGTLATAGDRIRKTFKVSPSAYPGTRLAQMSNLWERYRFTRFSLRYVPSVPNTLACQVVLYQDTDPQDDPTVITDADALIQQATAQTGSQQWNFNSAKRIELARRADKELYYTGESKENVRFNLQGVAYLIQQSACINFNGDAVSAELECGSVYVDWEVQFQTPQINPVAVTQAPATKVVVESTVQWNEALLQSEPVTKTIPASPFWRRMTLSSYNVDFPTLTTEDGGCQLGTSIIVKFAANMPASGTLLRWDVSGTSVAIATLAPSDSYLDFDLQPNQEYKFDLLTDSALEPDAELRFELLKVG